MGVKQRLVALRVTDDLRHVEIGDGETVAYQIIVAGKMLLQHPEGPPQKARGDIDHRFAGIAFRKPFGDGGGNLQRIGLDFGRCKERPLQHRRIFLQVDRCEQSAIFADEIKVDGHGFIKHHAVIFDAGDGAHRIDGQKRGGQRVERRVCGQGIGNAAGMHDRHVLEFHAQFPGKPERARGAGTVDTIDRQHRSHPFTFSMAAR